MRTGGSTTPPSLASGLRVTRGVPAPCLSRVTPASTPMRARLPTPTTRSRHRHRGRHAPTPTTTRSLHHRRATPTPMPALRLHDRRRATPTPMSATLPRSFRGANATTMRTLGGGLLSAVARFCHLLGSCFGSFDYGLDTAAESNGPVDRTPLGGELTNVDEVTLDFRVSVLVPVRLGPRLCLRDRPAVVEREEERLDLHRWTARSFSRVRPLEPRAAKTSCFAEVRQSIIVEGHSKVHE